MNSDMKPFTIFGVDVIPIPVRMVPKIQLGEAAPVSDKFREEFNAWLLEMFGTKDVSMFKPGTIYRFGNKIVMRPEDVVKISSIG